MSEKDEWWGPLAIFLVIPLFAILAVNWLLQKLVLVAKRTPSTIKGFVFSVYYRVYPAKLKEKLENEREVREAKRINEKARLLLDYEALSKEKCELEESLKYKAYQFSLFGKALSAAVGHYSSDDGKFFYREWPSEVTVGFRTEEIESIDEFKEMAEEYKQTACELFVVKRKLAYYGIKRD